ncbi:hypothetical protein, partial [Paracoccus sp. (in: a-proteobacteria)]|uniref:hypothetical protein n=1 Tax=Paracoccus sp. TaxID=267 RepID=UPI0035AEDC96
MNYAQIIGRLQADPVMLQLVLGGAALLIALLGWLLWRGHRAAAGAAAMAAGRQAKLEQDLKR